MEFKGLPHPCHNWPNNCDSYMGQAINWCRICHVTYSDSCIPENQPRKFIEYGGLKLELVKLCKNCLKKKDED